MILDVSLSAYRLLKEDIPEYAYDPASYFAHAFRARVQPNLTYQIFCALGSVLDFRF